MTAKTFIGWSDLELMVDALVYKMKTDKFKPDLIVGLSRGGLIPGVMLSHKMDVPFEAVAFSTRDFLAKDDSKIFDICNEIEDNNIQVLVVDDICDTGRTFIDLKAYFDETDADLKNVRWAALHYREGSEFKPDYFAQHLEDDSWIVYPYEAGV